jgi:hypothetical protein
MFFLFFASKGKIRERIESLEHVLARVKQGEVPERLRGGGSIDEITLKLEKEIKKLKTKVDR